MANPDQKRGSDQTSGETAQTSPVSPVSQTPLLQPQAPLKPEYIPIKTLSNGKNHEDHLEESIAGMIYYSHHEAGIAHTIASAYENNTHHGAGQSNTILNGNNPELDLILIVQAEAVRRTERSTLNDNGNNRNFHLRIVDQTDKHADILLCPEIMMNNPTMTEWLSKATIASTGFTMEYRIDSPWLTLESLQFGIAIVLGRDPTTWFNKNNFDESVPECVAQSVRESHQSMLLALQYLATASLFHFPREYQDIGLRFLFKNLNYWNLELALSFIINGHENSWDAAPHETPTGIGSTFESRDSINQVCLSFYGLLITPYLSRSILDICGSWLRNNLPNIQSLQFPVVSSTVLGDIELPNDAVCFRDYPDELKTYEHQLATLRIMSHFPPDKIPHPDPAPLVAQYILPMVLVSLPFGVLKHYLYRMNLSTSEKFVLAEMVCQWRRKRQVDAGNLYFSTTGRAIFWKRPSWQYEAEREPVMDHWKCRWRYIEMPYLARVSNTLGQVVEFFDLKRYWYEWQTATGEEWTMIKSLNQQDGAEKDHVHKKRAQETVEFVNKVLGNTQHVVASVELN